jgi:transcriptional regulator with XRE-family HTH domain
VAQSAFGTLLRRLREERRLTLRELSQLSEVDHAYIYRLETGEKESPSENVVEQLIKVLKPSDSVGGILHFLAKAPETDPALVEDTWGDPAIDPELFQSAAGMRFRGNARPDWKRVIRKIRKLREDMEGG